MFTCAMEWLSTHNLYYFPFNIHSFQDIRFHAEHQVISTTEVSIPETSRRIEDISRTYTLSRNLFELREHSLMN